LRPGGGNITGVSVDGGLDIYGKRPGLLVEAVPKVSHVHHLASDRHRGRPAGVAAREAARPAGISLTAALLGMTFNEVAYRCVFKAMEQDHVDALLCLMSPSRLYIVSRSSNWQRGDRVGSDFR
jgi:putative ABC transport system substrate-binding protein